MQFLMISRKSYFAHFHIAESLYNIPRGQLCGTFIDKPLVFQWFPNGFQWVPMDSMAWTCENVVWCFLPTSRKRCIFQ